MLYSPLEGGVHTRTGRIVPVHEPIHVDNPFQPAPPPKSAFDAHPLRQLPTKFDHGALEVTIRRGPDRRNYREPQAQRTHGVRLALRGGSQLIQTDRDVDRWLGLAHGCRVEENAYKHYWHYWFEVDSNGTMLSLSDPVKLDPDVGIEFAAGLALDLANGELVVTYGVEDDRAMLGVTELSAVLTLLRPIGTTAAPVIAGPREDDRPSEWADSVEAVKRGGDPTAWRVAGLATPAWRPSPQPTMTSMREALDYLRANVVGHDEAFAAAEAIAAGRRV
jgi:hypothetical protein